MHILVVVVGSSNCWRSNNKIQYPHMKAMSFQIQYTLMIITYLVTKMQAFFFFFLFWIPILFKIPFLCFFISSNYFSIVLIFFIEHAYFMPNIWVLHKPSKKVNQHFMLQMWILQNHSNKTNVYFVTLMQVYHIKLYVFEILLIQ